MRDTTVCISGVEDKLRTISFLRHSSEESIRRLALGAVIHSYKKGKILFIQDDPAERYYLICSGWIKLFRETLDGTQAVTDILNTGHVLGEGAMFNNNVYSVSAEVVENADVISLSLSNLSAEIKFAPDIAMAMLETMSHTVMKKDREIEHLSIQNAPQRIGCFLLRLIPDQTQSGRVTLHLPYDKILIASRLGMQPETFSRALKKLKNETDIQVIGSTIYINDIEILSSYSCAMCSSEFPCQDICGQACSAGR